jgi:pimeloyl-ACP methyl ester carboxylesterase
MRRVLRILLIGATLCAALVVVIWWSGRQQPIDVVAETEKALGIELESTRMVGSGVLIHVVFAGPKEGNPVVLLHGFPEFWWAWNRQIAALAREGFRVIALDQRGYNSSEKPRGVDAYRIDLLMADVIALIVRLRYEDVFLAGHDWGGAIAWRIAIEHPERVRKLVMFNAPHPLAWVDARESEGDERPIDWFRTFFQVPVLPELATRAGNFRMVVNSLRETSRPGTFSDREIDYYRYAWARNWSMHSMINWYRAAFRYPVEVPDDSVVRVPTRIVWGMQDRFFESRMAQLSLKYCANATLVEVPNAGHWLLHEEPELTSREMIQFFRAGAGVAPLR